MERTTDGKFVLGTRGLRVAQNRYGEIVIRPPLLPLIMAHPAVLWLEQVVAMIAQYALVCLAAALFVMVLMLGFDGPLDIVAVWLSYVALALLASYACRQLVLRLQKKRGKF